MSYDDDYYYSSDYEEKIQKIHEKHNRNKNRVNKTQLKSWIPFVISEYESGKNSIVLSSKDDLDQATFIALHKLLIDRYKINFTRLVKYKGPFEPKPAMVQFEMTKYNPVS